MRIAEPDLKAVELVFNFLNGLSAPRKPICVLISITQKEGLPLITSGLIIGNKNGKFTGISVLGLWLGLKRLDEAKRKWPTPTN